MAARYPNINEIFNELDAYRDFCREFGHGSIWERLTWIA